MCSHMYIMFLMFFYVFILAKADNTDVNIYCIHTYCHFSRQTDRQTDRQAGRQSGRQEGRKADRHTDRQTARQTERQINTHCIHTNVCSIILYSYFLTVKENR